MRKRGEFNKQRWDEMVAVGKWGEISEKKNDEKIRPKKNDSLKSLIKLCMWMHST